MLAEYKMALAPMTLDTAGPRARTVLEVARAQIGFIPNMYANMANSPGLLETYLLGYQKFREESNLTPPEQEVVFLTISRDNGCEYCVGAHSAIADLHSKLAPDATDAIRNRQPISEAKLQSLSIFTSVMVASRGLPSKEDVAAFLAAGYSEQNILEIILAISVKTLSNYANHIFHTHLDAMFTTRRWEDNRG